MEKAKLEQIIGLITDEVISNVDKINVGVGIVNFSTKKLEDFMVSYRDDIVNTMVERVEPMITGLDNIHQIIILSLAEWLAKQPIHELSTIDMNVLADIVNKSISQVTDEALIDVFGMKTEEYVPNTSMFAAYDLYEFMQNKYGANSIIVGNSAYSVNGKCMMMSLPQLGYNNIAIVPLQGDKIRLEVTNTPVYIVDNDYPSTVVDAKIGLISMIDSFISNGNGYGLIYNAEEQTLVA